MDAIRKKMDSLKKEAVELEAEANTAEAQAKEYNAKADKCDADIRDLQKKISNIDAKFEECHEKLVKTLVVEEVKDKDFVVPIGECKIEREGTDVTLVSYSRGVHTCMEACMHE